MLLAFLSEMSATCICLLYFITEFWNKQPRVKKKKNGMLHVPMWG